MRQSTPSPETLFAAVLELPDPAARRAYLDRTCAGDAALRQEVESLLAMMDHPNIARVFDGGATDTGRPYFVMELVKGIAITEYCDAAKLPTPERLRLFMQACQAVQHAHRQGINAGRLLQSSGPLRHEIPPGRVTGVLM